MNWDAIEAAGELLGAVDVSELSLRRARDAFMNYREAG